MWLQNISCMIVVLWYCGGVTVSPDGVRDDWDDSVRDEEGWWRVTTPRSAAHQDEDPRRWEHAMRLTEHRTGVKPDLNQGWVVSGEGK